MKKKLIINSIMSNKLTSAAIVFFMMITTLLFSLVCLLSVNSLDAIDALMNRAKTPDFLQMHSGSCSIDELKEFAKDNKQIDAWQIVPFLNINNSEIYLGENTLSDSTQDNGVCVQPDSFDYLLDLNNEIIKVEKGQIYVPVCYRDMLEKSSVSVITIADHDFEFAGFLRDSQMNSMMASSKRFLINKSDYEEIKIKGDEEYLIEFLLKDDADINSFSKEYADAKLPCSGPSVTKPLIKMMNAISDGMIILILALVSIIVLLISLLCIRFICQTGMNSSMKELGILKAIGISGSEIKKLYLCRYFMLAALGTISGLFLSFLIKIPLQQAITESYGKSEHNTAAFAVSILCSMAALGIILLSLWITIGKTDKISAVAALQLAKSVTRRKRREMLLIIGCITAGVFLMAIPANLSGTLSSPSFASYMGIGDAKLRIDLRQSKDIGSDTAVLKKLLKNNPDITTCSSLITKAYEIELPNAALSALNIEQGNHTLFPVKMYKGQIPEKSGEIALSALAAEDFNVSVGDSLKLISEGKTSDLTVCGIYSDITNGGKTAKMTYIKDDAPIMWSLTYLNIKPNADTDVWIDNMSSLLKENNLSSKITDINGYIAGTYQSTINRIKQINCLTSISSMLIILVVILLFERLIISEERTDISLKKALGINSGLLKKQFMRKYTLLASIGIPLGIAVSLSLGNLMTSQIIQSAGAMGFHFLINIWQLIPTILLSLLGIVTAAQISAKEIDNIAANECLRLTD